MTASRERLIKELWPDKILYGATLLMWTGLIGILYGLAVQFVTVGGQGIPGFLREYPPLVTVVLSAVAAGLGWLALTRLNTNYAIAGGVAGVLAFGLVGIGSLFSLVALAFVALSRREGEDTKDATLRLSEDEWPDKSLAASLMCLMNGTVTVVWGLLLLGNVVHLTLADPTVLGLAAVAVGALNLAAAQQMYHQRGPMLGLAAGLLGIATFALYLIGPILGIAALYYLNLAQREREFGRKPAASKPPTAVAAPKPPAAPSPPARASVRPAGPASKAGEDAKRP